MSVFLNRLSAPTCVEVPKCICPQSIPCTTQNMTHNINRSSMYAKGGSVISQDNMNCMYTFTTCKSHCDGIINSMKQVTVYIAPPPPCLPDHLHISTPIYLGMGLIFINILHCL